MNHEKKTVIAIATCNNEKENIRIGYCLQAISTLSDKYDIVIWDEGKVSITSDRWVRLMIELLGYKGHNITHLRRTPSQGVAMARRRLLTPLTKEYDRILCLDDDLLITVEGLENILRLANELDSIANIDLGLASKASTPEEADRIISTGYDTWGFIQGVKQEVDVQRDYVDDINGLWRAEDKDPIRLYFGDTSYLLLNSAMVRKYVDWDLVTKYKLNGYTGEDVLITIQLSDKVPCWGVPRAEGYHLSLANHRWSWEITSDVAVIEILNGKVSDDTLTKVFKFYEEHKKCKGEQ